MPWVQCVLILTQDLDIKLFQIFCTTESLILSYLCSNNSKKILQEEKCGFEFLQAWKILSWNGGLDYLEIGLGTENCISIPRKIKNYLFYPPQSRYYLQTELMQLKWLHF